MRESGILMPVSSLPGPYGIGCFGKEAFKFVDFLADAGQKIWQLLPLSPTGYGDSPYQSCSAFAGNPYLIDLDLLAEDGLLDRAEYEGAEWGNDPESVDYGILYEKRTAVLHRAFESFKPNEEFETFCAENEHWLEDYALFTAIKASLGGRPWYDWPSGLKMRDPQAMISARSLLSEEIIFRKAEQFWFFRQWERLESYANSSGVGIIGDLPIYVAHDSADVWANQHLFQLDSKGYPTRVAGVPPDYFSKTGQLWGNPVYNWSAHARTEYRWWVARLRHALNWFDALRLDHFRGFAAYYSVPARAKNARDGCWLPGPGLSLFSALQQALGDVPLLAEDLGFLDDTVRALLSDCGFPGMQVLQFDFDSRDCGGGAVCKPNTVIYTGTHDNDTLLGWCTTAPRQDIRRACAAYGVRYPNQLPRQMMLSALRSPANTCILTVQDLLGLGSSARINTPSTVGAHNWSWRMRPGALTPGILAHLYTETCAADRAERSNICRI